MSERALATKELCRRSVTAWTARVGLVLAVVASSPSARADDVSEEARVHFLRAVQLFKDADFTSALIEFNRAYAISPSYRVKYNIGYTCLELRDYPCALRAFQRYLSEGGAEVPADRLAKVEADIQRLRALVARLTILVNVPGAEVWVDDVLVGTSPLADDVLVSAGRRKVTVSLLPRPTVTRIVEVASGESSIVNVTLAEAAPLVSPAPAATTRDSNVTAEPERSKVPLFLGIGLTTALAGATATFGILTLSAKSDLDTAANRFGVRPSEVDAAQNDVASASLITDLFAGATVIVGVSTVVYYFLTSAPAKAKVGVSAEGARIRYSF